MAADPVLDKTNVSTDAVIHALKGWERVRVGRGNKIGNDIKGKGKENDGLQR
jgi:hypothetical protein